LRKLCKLLISGSDGVLATDKEKSQIVRENDRSYIVPGNMDVERLNELFGVRPEGHQSATIAGLVSEIAGRIPKKAKPSPTRP
jgi:CBS domain containing-hemolysin-like protein